MILLFILAAVFAGVLLEAAALMFTLPLIHGLIPQFDYIHPGYADCFHFAALTSLAWLPVFLLAGALNILDD